MIDVKPAPIGSPVTLVAQTESAGLDDPAVMRLLAATDPAAIAELSAWLKTHVRAFAPVVAQAIREGSALSAEAGAAVLDAFAWRATADAETTTNLMNACLDVIARKITDSVRSGAGGAIGDHDDALVRSAVTILTVNRRSSQSATAIGQLAAAGPGGALVLSRAFDAVRSGLRLCIVQSLHPADVLELGDNVVASLASSVSRLAEELDSPKKNIATRFLEALGPVHHMEPSEIGATEPLAVDDCVFHASWGAGVVIATSDESVTIDFGSAGTRTLLRSLATLRRAG